MKKRYTYHILFILLFFILLPMKAQENMPFPKYEVRAVWLTTIGGIDWPHSFSNGSSSAIATQKQELTQILDKLKKANINTVLIQTRVRGTTIYPSDIEPWDGCLSGKPGVSPGYDALQFAIEECHKRGMECHAWVVTMPIGKWNKAGCQNIRKTHPELVRKIADDGFMNPEHPGTAPYIARICKEIVSKYDIDGIHLDYIRYPDGWRINVSRSAGRDYITNIVREVHDVVKSLKPWVKMSCSPVGKFNDLARYSSHGWNAYHAVCQDAQGWLREGLMDQLYPMMYFRDNQFFPFAANWQENSYGRTVAPGLGIYFLDPREGKWQLTDVTRQLHVLRDLGMGHTYFRSKFFTDNTKGIYDYVVNNMDPYPALVPPMTWESKLQPTAPDDFSVNKGSSHTTLSWSQNSVSPQTYYNVYASRNYPVDITDVRNLIAQRVERNNLTIATNKEYFYALTAVNRYGVESIPVQSVTKGKGQSANMLSHNNKVLVLPEMTKLSNARFVTIETPQGYVVATLPITKDKKRQPVIDIHKINDGVYVIKTLDKRGIVHRVGMFTIKR